MIPYILAAVGGYLIGEATKKKPNPLDNPWNILEKGGETEALFPEIMTFEQFKKELPEVVNPFWGEQAVYKAKYDTYTGRTAYFKNGRKNSARMSLPDAYSAYLYRTYRVSFMSLPKAEKERLFGKEAKYYKLARGGRIEYAVEVQAKEKNGNRHRTVYDIEADSESEALEKAKEKFRGDYGMDDLTLTEINVMQGYEMMAKGGEVFLKNPKFTFKTQAEYDNARRSGYIDEYDIVRIVMVGPAGNTVDFPVDSEEEYNEVKNNENKAKFVTKTYQDKMIYDIMDYYEPEYDEYEYDYPEDEDYARGGKIKKSKIKKKRTRFVDKVNAIADRVEGQKVPTRLRKDYGGRYNRKEAEDSARRIAGSQLKKMKE